MSGVSGAKSDNSVGDDGTVDDPAAPGGGVARLRLLATIGGRLSLAIGLAVVAGIGGMILFHTKLQEAEILAANEHTLRQLSDSAQRGLETIMLGGYADIAPYFADRLKDIRDVDDFRIVRGDGREAFLDNTTVGAINERFGTAIFPYKPIERHVAALPPGDADLKRAIETRQPVTRYDTDADGNRRITILSPIVLDSRCHACHQDGASVNGVVKLTTSLAAVEQDIRATWLQALTILAVAVSMIVIATLLVVRRSVVRPIEALSSAMAGVADGHFDQKVPVIGRDELGQMAGSFNSMVNQLLRTYDGLQNEQNKLTTIILAAVEGIVVTDEAGNVVLVNPAAEALLGRGAFEIMGADFLDLIGDRARMQRWLDAGMASEDIAYQGRTLNIQVARITDEAGATVGSSALLRDITEERNLEQRLRSQSTTDALTGLWNRRHLDQTLAKEYDRARRYGHELSILLFDIDHFKRFNDTYGHDQGDRVLKAVAAQVTQAVRQVDVACRYGGEEFLVILPATDAPGAVGTAERLRNAIADVEVDGLQVTVTIGVTTLLGSDTESPAQLIELADKALYEGKRAGRNRVVLAGAQSAAAEG